MFLFHVFILRSLSAFTKGNIDNVHQIIRFHFTDLKWKAMMGQGGAGGSRQVSRLGSEHKL